VRKILALADDAAADHFRATSWMSAALADFGIEIHVVELPADLRARIAETQRRQYR
jgi:hypothetical protein